MQKYNSYVNSMSALQKTAKATNNSMTDIKDAIEDVNELKLMDDSDVTAATKKFINLWIYCRPNKRYATCFARCSQ